MKKLRLGSTPMVLAVSSPKVSKSKYRRVWYKQKIPARTMGSEMSKVSNLPTSMSLVANDKVQPMPMGFQRWRAVNAIADPSKIY